MRSLKDIFCGHGLYKSLGDSVVCLDFPEPKGGYGIYMMMDEDGLGVVSCYDHSNHSEYIIGVDLI